MGPPVGASLLTLNLRGGLEPISDKQAARGKLDYLQQLVIKDTEVQFVCLQDLGVLDDVVPALTAERFAKGHVRVHGTKVGRASVAILVAPGWEIMATHRHGSGRAIAVHVRRGDVELEIISVYMPPGLDSSSGIFTGRWADRVPGDDKESGGDGGDLDNTDGDDGGDSGDDESTTGHGRPGTQKRTAIGTEADRVRLAEDLFRFVRESMDRSRDSTLVGGDFNNTRCEGDRWRAPESGPRLPARSMGPLIPGRMINEFLGTEGRLTDILRQLRTDDGCICTYKSALRASGERTFSRLDYILVPTRLCLRTGGSWQAVHLPNAGHSDHSPQMVRFVGAAGGSSVSMWHQDAWSPGFARVARATPAEQVRIEKECNRRATNFLGVWRTARDRRALQVSITDFVRVMRGGIRAAVPSLEGRCSVRGRLPGPGEPLLRLRRMREASDALLDSIQLIRSGARASSDRAHRRAVGAFQSLAGVYAGIPHTDLDGLVALCEEVAGVDDELLESMVAEWRNRPRARGQHWRHLSSTHSDPRKLGRFITAYLRPVPSAALDRAVTECGRTVWEPEEYMPIVRDVVRGPLSNGAVLGRRSPMGGSSDSQGAPGVMPDLLPPFRSTDAGSRPTRPFWWDQVYDRGAKGIPGEVFANICDPPAAAELAAIVRGCAGGKSPGHDGLDIDFWKLVASNDDSPCLEVLTRIVGLSLELGFQPDALKHGWITMVPKVKPDGSFSCSPDDMRPITLLPEIGKITSRLLAKRIGDIFVQQPHLLSEAQRGFLAEGSVHQCVSTVVDVIEDWKQGRRDLGSRRAGPLYVLSYDQSKAYDSVQPYTIRASLERFNFPEVFIRYVLSGLDGATSRVRTKHGLTGKFDLRTGVRQGDPLSPLIYIITLDALHAGLRGDNPLFPTQSLTWGYRFRGHDPDTGDAVRIASVGYADDTVVIATSLESVTQMHAWVREFFGAHRTALNCSKSHLLCSDGAPVPALPSVDGLSLIEPKGEADTIRYLGAWINLRLDWSVHIARMDRFVWSVASSIRRNKFDLVMSKTTVNQFLLPGIRLGLLITDVPGKAVEAWDARIRQAALTAAGVTLRKNLNIEAFYSALHFPRLADQRWAMRGEEHMVSVIAQYPSSCSYRARLVVPRVQVGPIKVLPGFVDEEGPGA